MEPKDAKNAAGDTGKDPVKKLPVLKQETVQELADSEAEAVKGGLRVPKQPDGIYEPGFD